MDDNKLKQRLAETEQEAQRDQSLMLRVAQSKIGRKLYAPVITGLMAAPIIIQGGGSRWKWWGY